MNEQLQRDEFKMAIENLREDFKEHRTETREEFKALHCDMEEVKVRLTVIETQTKTTEVDNEKKWGHFSGWTALIIAAATAVIMWIKG